MTNTYKKRKTPYTRRPGRLGSGVASEHEYFLNQLNIKLHDPVTTESLRDHLRHVLHCVTKINRSAVGGNWNNWIIQQFLNSLPQHLARSLLHEWRAGTKETWEAMVALTFKKARHMAPDLGLDTPGSTNGGTSEVSNDTGSSIQTANYKAQRLRESKSARNTSLGTTEAGARTPTATPPEAKPATESVATGIGVTPGGSSTFFVSQYGTHSIVNDYALLINRKQLHPPALFAPPGAEDHPERCLIKATLVGELVFRRPSGDNIIIPEVYLSHKARQNLLGSHAITAANFSYDAEKHILTHAPSETRFLVDEQYHSFQVPHFGPGKCKPAQMEDGVGYCLDVCKVERDQEEEGRALSPTPELNEIGEVD
ncbi:hypothetical protein Q8F55_006354 [Vanrija albida]|uniref:Uncharacterized protein n=1 Tax=Vanrija albida TaxID=181172 RepID=A0ABR3PXP0_9TREE